MHVSDTERSPSVYERFMVLVLGLGLGPHRLYIHRIRIR